MNKILRKSIYMGLATLMVGSIGASFNTFNNSLVHASRISRLISERNHDSRKISYYNRQVTRLNKEINHLKYSHKSYRKTHKVSPYKQGYEDGFIDIGSKAGFKFTRKLDHNKQYKKGFIYAEMHASRDYHAPYRAALSDFKEYMEPKGHPTSTTTKEFNELKRIKAQESY